MSDTKYSITPYTDRILFKMKQHAFGIAYGWSLSLGVLLPYLWNDEEWDSLKNGGMIGLGILGVFAAVNLFLDFFYSHKELDSKVQGCCCVKKEELKNYNNDAKHLQFKTFQRIIPMIKNEFIMVAVAGSIIDPPKGEDVNFAKNNYWLFGIAALLVVLNTFITTVVNFIKLGCSNSCCIADKEASYAENVLDVLDSGINFLVACVYAPFLIIGLKTHDFPNLHIATIVSFIRPVKETFVKPLLARGADCIGFWRKNKHDEHEYQKVSDKDPDNAAEEGNETCPHCHKSLNAV